MCKIGSLSIVVAVPLGKKVQELARKVAEEEPNDLTLGIAVQ